MPPTNEPTVNDPAFWETLYREDRAGWDLGQAAPPFASWLAGPQAPSPGQRVEAQGLQAKLEQADLFELDMRWRGAFDLVVEHTCFCAIDPARRAEYVR